MRCRLLQDATGQFSHYPSIFLKASMLFHNINCYLISAVFLLQANMFDFLWNTAFLHFLSHGNKIHPAWYHNKHRCEYVKDRVLNGSSHGGSKQTQSQDILKSKNKMKHLFSKTNIREITGSERPSSAEILDNFLGGSTCVPHPSTSLMYCPVNLREGGRW